MQPIKLMCIGVGQKDDGGDWWYARFKQFDQQSVNVSSRVVELFTIDSRQFSPGAMYCLSVEPFGNGG